MPQLITSHLFWVFLNLSLLLVILSGCQEDLPAPGPPETAREWVEASARYHDPEARWQAFESHFEFESIIPNRGSYSNTLYLNRVLDTFSRTTLRDGFQLVQVAGPNGCSATWPNPSASEQELRENGLLEDPCLYVLFRRNFYEFLIGIPMIALEGEVDFRQNPNLVSAFGKDCTEIELTFPEGELTWYLYINPTSYRLEAAKFTNATGGGEWLSYEADTTYDGFVMKSVQRWYKLDGVTELVKDEIDWSN